MTQQITAPARGHAAIEGLVATLAGAMPDHRFASTEPPLIAPGRAKAIARGGARGPSPVR